ncbi:MAG: hypothetical protein JWO18_3103 [Microbacteriaceae bacterium]|nr:hypothetical protein [Microbacteriaceae bacterium]
MESHITPAVPQQAHAAFEALIGAMGTPKVISLTEHEHFQRLTPDAINMYHPVFGMVKHFLANDSGNGGYTANSSRGDHISIPGTTEDGGKVVIIDIGFHKGMTTFELVTFPDAHEAVEKAAVDFLDTYETR